MTTIPVAFVNLDFKTPSSSHKLGKCRVPLTTDIVQSATVLRICIGDDRRFLKRVICPFYRLVLTVDSKYLLEREFDVDFVENLKSLRSKINKKRRFS